MQSNQVVYEFEKNANEIVRVELSNYKGTDVIGIRVFFYADGEKDNRVPSKKGITMRADLIPELKKAVDKAYEEWKERITISS